jgi:hypothetical protein
LHLPEGWVVAVGVHPKHASDFGNYYFDRLSKLMDSPAVTALGEVGMDCSEGAKPFGIQKSTLRWVLAVLGSGNALGTAIPPYFVFVGKRMRSELLEGATPGASRTVRETGWSNSTVFRKYLEEHFMKYVQGRDPSEPLILLYDGHKSQVSLGLIDWAKELNLILFVLPPHTSHILQPLDVGCFGPFQKIYDNLKAKFMRENSSSSIPKHSVCNLSCKAYMLSLTPTNLCSSFRKCEIYPFDPSAVDAVNFLPSTVFKSKKTQPSEVEPTLITDTEPVNSPEAVESVPISRQDREQDTTAEFFRSKEDVLLDKSRETTKRKVLSAIVGGKAITEDHVIKQIQTHQEEQNSKKPKRQQEN